MKSLLIYFTDLDRPCQAFFLLVHQVGIRRPHRPPRVTLGSWQRPWLVVRGSWLVKTYHHTRIGMAKSHNGLPSHSCPFWQPSCTSRRSAPDGPKRLGTAPTHKAVGRVFFLQSVASFSPIACMRYRRGRPKHDNWP